MLKHQKVETRRQGGVHLYLVENEDIYGGHPGMQLAVADLGLNLEAIGKVISKQVRGSKPTTAVKADRELKMCHSIRKLCSGLCTVAVYGALPELMELTSVTKTYVDRLTAEGLIEFAGIIIKEALKYPDQLEAAGINPIQVDLFITQTETFKVWAKSPKVVIKKRKAATNSLPELLKKGRAIIGMRLDGFMLDYIDSHPEFYAGYVTSKEADHLAVHHKDEVVVDATDGK